MQRVRMSLPYFKDFGWEAEIVMVENKYLETTQDSLLLQAIPSDATIHKVKAFSKKWTGKLGLGSIALRSLWFYRKKVDRLLRNKKYDLVYFSTTQFPVCILGAYWKRKFGIPYVIDMQDPWHSEYYQNKPKNEQPPKYWFSYRLNKWLEPIAIKQVDGLIAVSEQYIKDLQQRYNLNIPNKTITFGYSEIDLNISQQIPISKSVKKQIKYIGVLGPMMYKSLDLFFKNIPQKLTDNYQLIFKGTSYASSSLAKKSTLSFQEKYQLKNIIEDTERIGIFQVLKELSDSEGLLIIGTDDAAYTASKLYPYLLVGKPLLAILHEESNANEILKATSNAIIINLSDTDKVVNYKIENYLAMIENNTYVVNSLELKKYSAQEMTRKQCELFDQVVK